MNRVHGTGRSEDPPRPTETWGMVTVTHNSAGDLAQYWGGTRLPVGVDWVVVDNCSTDQSADLAADLGARVVRLKKNLGFSAANNIGADVSRGEFLGFVNPDVTVDPSNLGMLVESIDRTNGIVAPQLVYPDGIRQPNGRGLPTLSNKFRNRIGAQDVEGPYNILPVAPGLYNVAWLMGAATCMKRSTFLAVGGWNSRYFVYFEDAELGLRAHSMGVPVALDSRLSWIHGWARAPKKRSLRGWRLELASAARFYCQHPWLVANRSAEIKFAALSSAVGTLVDGSGRP